MKIQYLIAIHLMRWLTNFHDFRFKWTATAAIGIHPTKAWLSRLLNFKMQSGRDDTLEERLTIQFFFKHFKKCHRNVWNASDCFWSIFILAYFWFCNVTRITKSKRIKRRRKKQQQKNKLTGNSEDRLSAQYNLGVTWKRKPKKRSKIITGHLVQWLECSPKAWETKIQSQVELYQIHKNNTWCLLT